jgi:TPR repeat protein
MSEPMKQITEESWEQTQLKLSELWDAYTQCTGSCEERDEMLYKFCKAAKAAGFTSSLMDLLRTSAQTCAGAMYEMGLLYESGMWGCQCNDESAESWFTSAAERGHRDAKEKLEHRAAKKAQSPPQP